MDAERMRALSRSCEIRARSCKTAMATLFRFAGSDTMAMPDSHDMKVLR
jgi:hypothetical protein